MGLLRELGYRNLRHYVGGLAEWKERGGALETPRPARARPVRRARARRRAPRRALSLSFARRTTARIADEFAERSVPELIGIWFAMVLGCGLVYWLAGLSSGTALRAGGDAVPLTWSGLLTAVYFSLATATTLGFGDVLPEGALRALAVAEAAAGLLLFGLLISKIVSRRQEQLTEEIHRIAFEDRLGRVRTNLHLVLTDLEAISRSCAEQGWPRDRLLARLQSAAMVFVGELRAVHDLLYRPQQEPEAEALGVILASLAQGLAAFRDLAGHLPADTERPTALRASLGAMSTLAREICGECVPREIGPALEEWTNQIQSTARSMVV